jgi:hypothetical protein
MFLASPPPDPDQVRGPEFKTQSHQKKKKKKENKQTKRMVESISLGTRLLGTGDGSVCHLHDLGDSLLPMNLTFTSSEMGRIVSSVRGLLGKIKLDKLDSQKNQNYGFLHSLSILVSPEST